MTAKGHNESSAQERGVLITFEGGDGVGKSTHIAFLANVLESHGLEVLKLREPGGTSVGEQLRAIVLDPANTALCDETELLIYEAARAQIVAEVVKPALERGCVVLCDRFIDSTVAYQSFGRGIARSVVDDANTFACQGIVPDRTILLTAGEDASIGLGRTAQRREQDRLEQAGSAFHNRVAEGFARLAREDPARIRTVASTSSKPDTARAVFAQLEDLFPWMGDGSVDFDVLDRR